MSDLEHKSSKEESLHTSPTEKMFSRAAKMFSETHEMPKEVIQEAIQETVENQEEQPAEEHLVKEQSPKDEVEHTYQHISNEAIALGEMLNEEEDEKSIRDMSVSEILEDYDWEDYEDVDLDEDYHHHVKKERKPREHRLWVRLGRRILVVIAIVAALTGVFLYGFRMNNVVVTGNYMYSDEEVLSLLGYYKSPKNTLYFTWKNREDLTSGVQFIDRITVTMGGPTTVYVTVKEKMIIGCIDDNGLYMFFDNTGEVVESSTTRPDDVPLVIGLDVSGITIGDVLDLENKSIFNNLYELTVLLKNYEVRVDEICYNDDHSMVMYRGDIKILLGMGNNLEDKINAYKDLESSLEGKAGVLHLEDYDSSKESIFFSQQT